LRAARISASAQQQYLGVHQLIAPNDDRLEGQGTSHRPAIIASRPASMLSEIAGRQIHAVDRARYE